MTDRPTLFEQSVTGRPAAHLPTLDVPESELPPSHMLRRDLNLPEVSELDLVRHYVHLSQVNYAVDAGFYPLGSCTMKYNPKVNEDTSRLPGFAHTHPYQAEDTVQGNLRLMHELQTFLGALSGFPAVSLQPAAGAQGELAGILMIRAYHLERGDERRDTILIPDSAHGTNPASTTMAGYETVQLASDARGNVDIDDLRANLNDRVAGLMLTNPNTLGLFDENVLEITRLVHDTGGLVYGDGANFNALMGIVRPADLGFDVMHFNLHKTFSTPHGGGGPGSGPVGASERLARFLPGPIVVSRDAAENAAGDSAIPEPSGGTRGEPRYRLEMPSCSIGRLRSFYGHFGILVRAYTYIRMLGAQGLLETTRAAVLNANYLQALLKDTYPLPHDRVCMHEFALQGVIAGAPDVRALDVAKRLIDYGFHPPTNYFPLIVPEALMIEPTETESKQTLDRFAQAMLRIAQEAAESPELLYQAPSTAPVGRLDEVLAARQLVLRWEPGDETEDPA